MTTASPPPGSRRVPRSAAVLVLVLLAGGGAGLALRVPWLPWAVRPATTTAPAGWAATVDGQGISMASFRRQVTLFTHLYSGPRGAQGSAAAATVMQIVRDRAIDQAVGEYLIVRAAKSAHVIAPSREVAATLAGMLEASGGAARARAALGLTLAEARRAATIAVLNKLLVSLRHDRHWLERELAQSTVVYYVGSRAGLSPALSPAGDPGHVAPDLAARDLAGQTVVLSSLRGHPLVLNIWAITCPGCDDDLVLLQRFATRHPTVRVVSLDEGDGAQSVRSFVRGLGVTYPIWLDGQSTAEDLYSTTGLPATYFIDDQGIVRDMNIGPLVDAETLEQRAASILPAPALQARAP